MFFIAAKWIDRLPNPPNHGSQESQSTLSKPQPFSFPLKIHLWIEIQYITQGPGSKEGLKDIIEQFWCLIIADTDAVELLKGYHDTDYYGTR